MFKRELTDGTTIELLIYNKNRPHPTDIIKCTECKKEFRRSDNININYEGSSDFDCCSIDCIFKHVAWEILSDDRPSNDMTRMLVIVEKKFKEENT